MQPQKNSSAEQLRQKIAIAEMAAKDERLTPETRERARRGVMMGNAMLELLAKQAG